MNFCLTGHIRGRLESFTLDAELNIPAEGVTALFGPSGSGKSTILKSIAGLLKLENSSLRVFEKDWQTDREFLAPHKRPIGYVFQDARLFDHLNVEKNLVFGLKRSNEKDQLLPRDEVYTLLGLTPMLHRSVRTLSGGEKQRVAIGRALLSSPRLLLMDEPLSALDRQAKDEIIPYLERLKRRLRIPILYVSHDMREIERIADHILLLDTGRVVGEGPLIDILSNPDYPFVGSDAAASIISGTIRAYHASDHLTELEVKGQAFLLPGNIGEIGSRHRVRIAASDVSLAKEKPSKTTILNILPVQVHEILPSDEGRVNVTLHLGDTDPVSLVARISSRSLSSFDFKKGQSVYAQIKGVPIIERK
ncbi:MAG: molybdenum ABC transporter ATP-binding protein [Sneathiellales bacterium]|nr:molybdenum ABC transporter ATP-binding protein [Sneathiellales bacterium]